MRISPKLFADFLKFREFPLVGLGLQHTLLELTN